MRAKGSAPAWYRLGTLQLRRGRVSDAADSFRQALSQQPDMAEAWHNLGQSCQLMQQHDDALTCYRRALQISPDDPCTLNNLGVLLREMGRLDASLQFLTQLTTRYPDDGDGRWNRALTLLTAGHYREGWREYEWRFRRSRPVRINDPGTPRWQGEPLEGKTILLCCEQAYGDSIQFVRFAATLADWGGAALLLCPDRSLAGLLSGAPGISRTLLPEEPLPPHDYWSPLLSLPFHLEATRDTIPPPPYLFATDTRNRIPLSDERLRVGLVWSGRGTDPHRACPAALFAPLSGLKGRIAFFSLQLNGSDQELSLLREQLGITDLAPLLTDFQATADIMGQLDLIISIDSAPAHLAGALGRETWLLLHHSPDWRWGQGRDDSDWYHTMRLFRQARPGQWEAVIERVAEALETRLASPGASISVCTSDDLLHMGDQHRHREQWTAAHHLYRLSALRSPDSYRTLLCAGGSLIFLNRPESAAHWFRRAMELEPADPDAHVNLGLALLSCGRWTEGWREFDWRCRAISEQLPPIPLLPAIAPGTRLDGTTVLIHSEQGYGDLLQFARYLPLLAMTGARVVITVQPAMVRLISRLAGIARVVPHGEPLPNADFQLPLLSLPDRLSGQVPDIPVQVPYLVQDPKLRADWQARLPADDRLKVGLVWRGSNLGTSGYRRSLTAELLAPLARTEEVALFSLQVGATAGELALIPSVIDLAPQISDFADTAAIMGNLDLIISVDTSTVHLAGALGVRCWAMLLFAPDWRWHPLQEPGSRWYPGMAVFRQPVPGRWEPVIARIAAALQGEALIHRGHRLGRSGRRAEAIAAFSAAADLPGESGPALLNLGIYLRADGQPHQAKEALRRATDVAPDYPEAWQNLGLAHQYLNELPEAYTCLKRALALRPNYPTARWNLGLLQLLLGEYGEGLRNFEARFTKVGAVARLHTDIPAWDGSPLGGRSILIHAEQGYGDTLQFVRFIPLLAEMGGAVTLEVQDRSLITLCATVPGVEQVFVRGDALPPFNLQAPLLSLPHLLGTTLATIPHETPYLSVDRGKVAEWQRRLPRDERRTIGICWKGRPTPDPRRSVPFTELAPLFTLPGIRWVSLQTERDASAALPSGMLDPTGRFNDFADTAALMGCLDLVISIDSAVAHLAGALGVPGIVLLPFAPDWRWTLDRERSPWYPTLRLVRQNRPGEWGEAVRIMLHQLARGDRQP